jgi:nitrous oxide reductase accessory protein NosL
MKRFRIIPGLLVAAMLLAACATAAESSVEEPRECTENSDCAQSEFCDTTPHCPGGDLTGTCTPRPQICTMEYDPVTGCNGKEYANRCAAAADGQPNTGAAQVR